MAANSGAFAYGPGCPAPLISRRATGSFDDPGPSGVRIVAFVVHEGRESAVTTAKELRERLEGVRTGIARAPEDVRDKRPDLVVSVGGDGTFFRGAPTSPP